MSSFLVCKPQAYWSSTFLSITPIGGQRKASIFYLWHDGSIFSNQEEGEVSVGEKGRANSGTAIQYHLAEPGLASHRQDLPQLPRQGEAVDSLQCLCRTIGLSR